MKKLYCHTSLVLVDDIEVVSEGKTYDVNSESEFAYYIISEHGTHCFTKEPDEIGESYKTWFDLMEGE